MRGERRVLRVAQKGLVHVLEGGRLLREIGCTVGTKNQRASERSTGVTSVEACLRSDNVVWRATEPAGVLI